MIYSGDGFSDSENLSDDEDDLHENGSGDGDSPPNQKFRIEEILPESLEILEISGSLPGKEWRRVKEQLGVPNSAFPNLKRVRLDLGAGEVLFELRPDNSSELRFEGMWNNPLRDLLRGHGYA